MISPVGPPASVLTLNICQIHLPHNHRSVFKWIRNESSLANGIKIQTPTYLNGWIVWQVNYISVTYIFLSVNIKKKVRHPPWGLWSGHGHDLAPVHLSDPHLVPLTLSSQHWASFCSTNTPGLLLFSGSLQMCFHLPGMFFPGAFPQLVPSRFQPHMSPLLTPSTNGPLIFLIAPKYPKLS